MFRTDGAGEARKKAPGAGGTASAQSSSSSEAFLRDQLEASNKEIKQLKLRIDTLEKENQQLKKSVYDLSFRASPQTRPGAFDLDAALDSQGSPAPTMPPPAVRADAVAATTPVTPASAMGRDKDARLLHPKHELRGHTGAVYAVQFSHCGRFLASGSFDKTVRVWDAMTPTELKRLDRHALNVADLAWSWDSAALLSGGYDQTCVLWDVEAAKSAAVHKVDGFVLAMAFGVGSNDVYYAGTSRKQICLFDRRKPGEPPVSVANDAMVNTLCSVGDEYTVVTGDSDGALKVWDMRAGKCLESFANDTAHKAISHVHVARRGKDEDDLRFLAANSYDNVLRVYDRGNTISPFTPKLVHALKAHRNQNWPIRSSFFVGPEYTAIHPSVRQHTSELSADDHDESQLDLSVNGITVNGTRTAEQSLLLATGSADSYAYVYDVSGHEGSAELVQRLEGHSDRVYAAAFHPSGKPYLATGSADFSVRLWSTKARAPLHS